MTENEARKTKVSSVEILVHGSGEKPYYEIKYHNLADGQCHVGYSSYNLDYVFEWLKECFEAVREDKDGISEQVKEIRAYAYAHEASGDAIYETASILYQAADTIEALSAKVAAADMERSDIYYGELVRKDDLKKQINEKCYPERFGGMCNVSNIIYDIMQVIDECKIVDAKRLNNHYSSRWFLCKNSLPKNMENVLIFYKAEIDGGTHDGEEIRDFGIGYYFSYSNTWSFVALAKVKANTQKIIAWQPLPQPYISETGGD